MYYVYTTLLALRISEEFIGFPPKDLSVSGSVCVTCIEYLLHYPGNKTFDESNNIVETS